jgi:hypothetical protein
VGHVEGVGDPDDARLHRERLTTATVADDRVQRLGDHHGQLGIRVGVGEQLAQLALGEKEAEGLVVDAVDRHAHVVQKSSRRDHHLRVAVAHAVVADHRGLDPRLDQQAQQAESDVEDDLDVNPGVVRHSEALGVHLRQVPPATHLGVAVDAVDQRLQLAVAARRRAHPDGLDRLRRHAPSLPGARRLVGLRGRTDGFV